MLDGLKINSMMAPLSSLKIGTVLSSEKISSYRNILGAAKAFLHGIGATGALIAGCVMVVRKIRGSVIGRTLLTIEITCLGIARFWQTASKDSLIATLEE